MEGIFQAACMPIQLRIRANIDNYAQYRVFLKESPNLKCVYYEKYWAKALKIYFMDKLKVFYNEYY